MIMQYRKDKNGNEISVLGYGCMRFTKEGGHADIDKAEKEVMAAIDAGVNYLDTAYVYAGNEAAVGEILARNHCRERIYLATKLPHYLIKSVEGAQKKNKVVNIHATTQLKVVLVKPERFEDASTIADHLNNKRTVVLNLESTNKEVSRRLVDFLSGVAYANNGQIKRVANSTFIITPYNVDIMGDLLDELENNGAFY